jgi:hypothetical protein
LLELTTALKVTVCPYTDGFSADEITVLVAVTDAKLEAAASTSNPAMCVIFIPASSLTSCKS